MGSMYGKSLKILLINAIDSNSEVESRYPNLGLGYLAAAVRKSIIDVNIQFLVADKNIDSVIKSFKPDLACVTAVSQNCLVAEKIIQILSCHNIPNIIGGIHLSVFPKWLPKETSVGCIGEGEKTFVEIVKLFLIGKMTPKHLYSVSGIVFWDNDRLQITEARKPIPNLDDIPNPARDLFKIEKHAYMFTSRGCPYNCTFCSSSRYWGKTRFFSAEYVVDEIEMLYREYDVEMIRFFDDLFIAKRSRLEEIYKLLEKRNLLGKIKYTCNCRANLIDDDIADLLSHIGVVSTGFGLESGDEETLKYLKCGNVSVEHNFNAVETIKKAGIAANGSFVIGSPQESRESIMRTYNFIRKSKLDWFEVYILTPMPGTPVWDYAKERGLVDEDNFDWSRLNVNIYRDPDKAIILSETLSKQELIELYLKFRRLRILRGVLGIWNNPLRNQIPKYAYSKIFEFISDKIFRFFKN